MEETGEPTKIRELSGPKSSPKLNARFRSNLELKLTTFDSPSLTRGQLSRNMEDPTFLIENFLSNTQGNYSLVHKLGSGRQGTVYKFEREGKYYAGKIIHTIEDEEKSMSFESEYNIIKDLDHRFLPRVQEMLLCPTSGWKCIIMDFFEGETLQKYLEKHTSSRKSKNSDKECNSNTPSPLNKMKHSCFANSPSKRMLKLEKIYMEENKKESEDSPSPDRMKETSTTDDRLQIYKNILEGIEYLHRNRICHRDLNLENILVNETNLTVRIIDFGLAKKGFNSPSSKAKGQSSNNDFMMTPIGYLDFRAPEVLQGDSYSEKVDIWTCGIIFLRLFGNDSKISSKRLLKHFDWESSGEHQDLSPSNDFKIPKLLEPLYPMVREMLRKEPARRISASRSLEQLREFLQTR